MKKFKIDGFAVVTNSDLTEGRGHSVTIAYTSNRSTAEKISIGKGVMGSPADVLPTYKEIIVYDTYAEYEDEQTELIKQNALKKLTDEEKKLLGLI